MKNKRWHCIAALALAFAVTLSFMPFKALAFNEDETKAEQEVKVESQKESENPEKTFFWGDTLKEEQADKQESKTDEGLDKSKAAEPTHKAQKAGALKATVEPQGTITFKWHHSKTGKGFYNPNDEGKTVSFDYFVKFESSDPDQVDKTVQHYFKKRYTGKIGKEQTISIPLGKITAIDGKEYTNCELKGIILPLSDENRIYDVGSSTTKKNQLVYSFAQNMETQTNAVIEGDAIILDEDKDNIKVRFTVGKQQKGQTEYPLSNKTGKVIEHVMDFKEGTLKVWNDSFDNPYSFYRSILGGSTLEQFSPYTGKYKDFLLHADFHGENKGDLEKKYELEMKGNDVEGWTLTLKSKLKKEIKDTVEDLDFTTERVADNTMIKGKEVIKQKGKKGRITHHNEVIYLPGTDGAKEVVQTKEVGADRVEPVKEIIHYGTKEAVPPTINGAVDKTITRGDTFNPLDGITAVDQDGNPITLDDSVVTENTVKTDTVGDYKVTYTVTDKNGTKATKTIKVKVVAKTFVLTFDANGGKFQDNTSVKTFKYKEGEKIKIIAAPSREGYKFDYWKGSKYNPGDEYEVKDNHTFTAQWIEEEKPTPKPGTGDGGTTPAKPGTDNGNKKPENTGDKNPAKPANPANPKKSPNTGDSSALAGYGLILLAGTALVAMTSRKKNMR